MNITYFEFKKMCEQCYVAGLNDYGKFDKFFNEVIKPKLPKEKY